jgi:uncharacterized protein with von Willebrand factor type A (vWA) domain
MRVTTGQIADLSAAVSSIDIGNVDDFYAAARCLLLSRHTDEPRFRALFEQFWLRRATRDISDVERDMLLDLPRRDESPSAGEGNARVSEQARIVHMLFEAGDGDNEEIHDAEEADGAAAYSVTEVLRHRDFAQLTPREIAEVRQLIAGLRYQTPTRKLRRMKRANQGPRLDPRRALRENLSNGGEPIILPRRTARRSVRPLVLLCDISGSMERYTSVLLQFLHAVRQGRGGVETFVFGTRLTRITRQLRIRDTDAALAEVAGHVNDWGGGTRIGESIGEFNRRWGRRVLGHDATVIVISDGWDRGAPEVLAGEMAHLQRLAHRLIWLNPLLGLPGYEPLTRGIRAALPFIDDFLASHNLASLEQLADFLRAVDDHRPERRQTAASSA